MNRYMADSIDAAALDSRTVTVPNHGTQHVALTAGYANGSFHDQSQAHGATDVQIDVNGQVPGADVLDIETGDATPQQAVAWVHGHNAHGGTAFPAVLYVNRGNRVTVQQLCDAAGLILGRDYFFWVSTLDGTETLSDMTGVVAVQVWGAGSFDRNIDLSIVYNDAWKPTGTAPVLDTEDHMYSFTLPANSSGGRYALTLPVSRQCEVTLSVDGKATLTEYGWVSPSGGNGFSEKNVALPDQGAHAFQPPKGTGKVDIQYTSDAPVNGVVDILS